MINTIQKKTITLSELGRELKVLQKKMFIYETLNSEKEIIKNQIKGPFKNGRELMKYIKTKD
ncbi:MAG: hypothetical protein AABY84_11850 [Candidatus Firestonebacteria bacterium]